MIIGVDTGGTFTDLVLFHRGEIHTFKTPSTPPDYSRGIQLGIRGILKLVGRSNSKRFQLVHSSTVATNALLERKGAKVGLITTGGFRDLLEIGRQHRPSLYDLQVEKPTSMVSRKHCWEIPERIASDGRILRKIKPAELENLLDQIGRSDVENVAVSLLFSFLNPRHEKQIARKAEQRGIAVTLSSQICPEFREFERTSTTVVNAYVSPKMKSYLKKLENGVKKLGATQLRIIQSNGGSLSPSAAGEEAVHTLLSGPAAGCTRRPERYPSGVETDSKTPA